MDTSKFIGCVLIVIGTTIGAGMLALPLVSASSGFICASLLMIGIWAIMTITGLLVLEVNLALDSSSCSFSSMADKTIGKAGKIVAWITCLLLLYALTAAYMAGAASLLTKLLAAYTHFQIPNFANAVLFTLIFGGVVFWSTKATDYVNRGLISIKAILLFATLILLMPHINVSDLLKAGYCTRSKYLFSIAPIFLCAFGYHTVIPSLRMYIGDKPRELKKIIIVGTTVPLAIYIMWLAATLGIVPLVGTNSFTTLAKNHGSIGELVGIITLIISNKWIAVGINGFSNVAMTTSFLGVTLGLFDFLADGFKRSDDRKGRAQTALLTFIPPLIFAFCCPQGFVLALGYAAIFVAILEIILPAAMTFKMRKNPAFNPPYRFCGGNGTLLILTIIGVILIALQILNDLHLLPEIGM